MPQSWCVCPNCRHLLFIQNRKWDRTSKWENLEHKSHSFSPWSVFTVLPTCQNSPISPNEKALGHSEGAMTSQALPLSVLSSAWRLTRLAACSVIHSCSDGLFTSTPAPPPPRSGTTPNWYHLLQAQIFERDPESSQTQNLSILQVNYFPECDHMKWCRKTPFYSMRLRNGLESQSFILWELWKCVPSCRKDLNICTWYLHGVLDKNIAL